MSDTPSFDVPARRREFLEWRATLTKEDDETVDEMLKDRGEEYVLSILGHLKIDFEIARTL